MSPDSMVKLICFYHRDCNDGLGAVTAVAAYAQQNAKQFFPVVYQDVNYYDDFSKLIPHCKDAVVYVVDFCFDLETIKQIVAIAAELVIIDHHEVEPSLHVELTALANNHPQSKFSFVHSKEHSGAYLTWSWLIGYVPKIILHVEDRDLWKFNLPETPAVDCYLKSLPKNVEAWLPLMDDQKLPEIMDKAKAVLDFKMQLINSVINQSGSGVLICNNTVALAVINIPHALASDAIDLSMTRFSAIVGIGWYQTNNGRYKYSVRSMPNSPLTAYVFAKQFGGGGHIKAAGFETHLTPEQVVQHFYFKEFPREPN